MLLCLMNQYYIAICLHVSNMQAPFFISLHSMHSGFNAISAIIWLLFDQIGQFLITLESIG